MSDATQMDAAQLDAAAVASYQKNAQAFTRFPLDKIRFEVQSIDGKKTAFPQLYVDGKQETGLTHVVPFSKILFVKFGPNGNLHQARGYAPGTIDEPKDAEQQFTISNRALSGEGLNTLTDNYFAWLSGIEGKLIDHILANLDSYPALKKKYGNLLSGDQKIARELLASGISKSTRASKAPEEGKPIRNYIAEEKLMSLKQKLYVKALPDRLQNARPRTEIDGEALKQGLVRRHIPLFNANGQEINVNESALKNFDIVSTQLTLNGTLYDIGSNVGFGLRKNIRSIVYLRSTKTANAGRAPPVAVEAPSA